MSERIVTFCDFCNEHQSTGNSGRGVVEAPEQDAIELFGWYRTEDGKIMCIQCMDEMNIGYE